jgi:hypothetical protein
MAIDMELVKKMIADRDVRQRDEVGKLGLPESEQALMLGQLDGFLRMTVAIVGNCVSVPHQAMILRFLIGRMDDMISIDRRKKDSEPMGEGELAEMAERRVLSQAAEARARKLSEVDACDSLSVVQVLQNNVVMLSRLLAARESFMRLAKAQMEDLITIVGFRTPDPGNSVMSSQAN